MKLPRESWTDGRRDSGTDDPKTFEMQLKILGLIYVRTGRPVQVDSML